MNPHAADSDKATKILTPWETIDPSEPAALGVVCAPQELADEPEVIVYRVERRADATSARTESPLLAEAPLRQEAHLRTELQPPAIEAASPATASVEIPAQPVTSIAEQTPKMPANLLAQAEKDLAAFDPEHSLQFDDDNQVASVTVTEQAEPPINLEALAEPSVEIPVPIAENSHEEVQPPLVVAATTLPKDASPELFVDVPDALDTLPETLAPITDISQAIGDVSVVAASVIDLKPMVSFENVDQVDESNLIYPVEIPETPVAEAFEEPIAVPVMQEIEEANALEIRRSESVSEFEPGPVWEDPEMEQEPEPVTTGASWTIPLLCLGIGLIACCVVIPQADANRRLAYEKQSLQMDLESVQKQVAVNDEFLKRVVDDPSLSERLAQRQLKRVRKGQRVLQLKDEKQEMSPFQIVNVAPPAPLPPYKPAGGLLASLCYEPRTRLYTLGAAMVMIACGLVLGSSPIGTARRPEAIVEQAA